MKLARNLNFIVPVYGDEVPTKDGEAAVPRPVTAYVHSVPIAAEVAERYFLILAQTFSGIFNLGLGVAAGPGVAMRLLKKLAVDRKEWEDVDGTPGVKNGLIADIRRSTTVLAMVDNAWQPLPVQIAVDRGLLSEEDRAEVENAIVFFIAVSATLGRVQRKEMMEAACGLWDARVTSSNSTEFAASLPKSIVTGSSGASSAAAAPGAQPDANATVDGKPSVVPS